MQVITFEDINNIKISPLLCYEWVSEMIKNKNETILPPKISMHLNEGEFCNVMPCVLNSKIGGVKIVNRYLNREPSLNSRLLLMDMNTGEYLALMDATWITAMRTGAVAAHTVLNFAKSDFKVISILGLGNTARATLLVMLSIIPNKKLKIRLMKYKGQEETFKKRFEKFANIEFVCIDSIEELVRGADVVISCATYLDQDLCSDECFDEGVLVVPVHTRGFTNCDLFFDKVFADDYGHVCHFKNFSKFRYFSEVCDVVNEQKKGRTNDKERIIVYNIGLSIHDIHFATHIYRMLEHSDDIGYIDFKDPKDKFWV